MTPGLRQVVVWALDALRCPLAHEDLAVYATTFHDLQISGDDLTALLEEERRCYRRGEQRQTWICPTIMDSPGFPADDHLLTRSDWSLDNRVLGRSSEAVRQIWLIRQFGELLKVALERQLPNVRPLMEYLRLRCGLLLPSGIVDAQLQLARTQGGTEENIGGLPALEWLRFTLWQEIADDGHSLLASVDNDLRVGIADELASMSSDIQLFGGTPE